MSHVFELIKALFPGLQNQKSLDEAYLAQSADMFDLERRMRDLDNVSRQNAKNLIFGTMMP
jgi:hypothetical protein